MRRCRCEIGPEFPSAVVTRSPHVHMHQATCLRCGRSGPWKPSEAEAIEAWDDEMAGDLRADEAMRRGASCIGSFMVSRGIGTMVYKVESARGALLSIWAGLDEAGDVVMAEGSKRVEASRASLSIERRTDGGVGVEKRCE